MDCRVVFGLENFPDSPLSVEGSVLSMIKVRSARMADELHAAETKDSLVTLRRTLGVTGAAVADLCGISFKAVSHWECGSNAPYVNTLQRYARALGMLSGNGGYLSLSLADGWR
jgi:DNA-binding transcriptional regulator YiaG